MVFQDLVEGIFIKRYKRFLVDVRLMDGQVITAHCTNSGSLKSAIKEGAPVMLSKSSNPKRKTKYTWEMIQINGTWVGVNTNNANILAYEFVRDGLIELLPRYNVLRREMKFYNSRLDLYAENANEKVFIEVKNVTLKEGRYAKFPDAKTLRGQKHLQTLIKAIEEGYRAIMLYIVQRTDTEIFSPAEEIDPVYSALLKEAYNRGVEIIPIQVKITPSEASFYRILPFELN